MTFTLKIQTAEDCQRAEQAANRAAINAAVTERVESEARARGYDSAAQLASYVASTVPGWAAEALAFVAWRDACWQAVFALPDGTPLEAALAALPPAPADGAGDPLAET